MKRDLHKAIQMYEEKFTALDNELKLPTWIMWIEH